MYISKKLKEVKQVFSVARKSYDYPFQGYMNKNKCIFIHIPKTGGTSVRHALGAENRRLHLPWFNYAQADHRKFNSFLKFAFVRHPVTRAFSAFNYLKEGGNQSEDLPLAELVAVYKTFDEFVIKGLGSNEFMNHGLFYPQAYYICDWQGNVKVDFLGRFEKITQDSNELFRLLSINQQLEHKNRSKRDSTIKVSEAALDILAQLYANDFKWLGYKLDEF